MPSIFSFFTGLPWIKMGIFIALVSGVVYGVHLIGTSGQQAQEIKQLNQDLKDQHDQDQSTINQLQVQYLRDTTAISKEKDYALSVARRTQDQLNAIKDTPSGDDGPVRPVISRTLGWLRGYEASGNNHPDASPAR